MQSPLIKETRLLAVWGILARMNGEENLAVGLAGALVAPSPPPYTPWLLPVVGQLNVFIVGVQTALLGLQTLVSLQYEPASGWLCHWCNGLCPIRIRSLQLYRCYPTQDEQNWRE